jgi:hypothetical protein
MNTNSNFVEAFISAVQVWNLEMDIEESHMDNVDVRALNRFVYSDLIGGQIDE